MVTSMKMDTVTWVKDGAWCLPTTLKRLGRVIPAEIISQKIAVDDRSSDDTVAILKDFGWKVYPNPQKGISCGANYALSKVTTPTFMSFEQDLFLSDKFIYAVIPLLNCGDVAVASGIRYSSKPKAFADLTKYNIQQHYKKQLPYQHTYGKTLDNTVYKTKVIRSVGGFPYVQTNSGIDPLLVHILHKHGFRWEINLNCVSIHMRQNFRQELGHQRWYATVLVDVYRRIHEVNHYFPKLNVLNDIVKRFLVSPIIGVYIALKMRSPFIAIIHPVIKLYYLLGYLDSKGMAQ
jgi:hypothetical protein